MSSGSKFETKEEKLRAITNTETAFFHLVVACEGDDCSEANLQDVVDLSS